MQLQLTSSLNTSNGILDLQKDEHKGENESTNEEELGIGRDNFQCT